MRIALTILLCIFAIPATALPECGDDSASLFTQRFFELHYNFYWTDPTPISELLTPEFRQKIERHDQCQIREGQCHMDYDPWLGAQDGEIGKPITFTVKEHGKAALVIAMTYPFAGYETPASTRHTVLLKLRRIPAPQCWRLQDLITPSGHSVSHAYSGKR